MSDRVSSMARERGAVSVLLLSFMRLVSNNRSATVCFFEGEDQKYYSIRLDMSPRTFRWMGIDCGGKKNVLALRALVSTNEAYRDCLVACFVDRDFDDPIPNAQKSGIYETPCYSIENLYCTDHCLTRVLNVEFKLGQNESRPELTEKVMAHFMALRKQFHEHIRPLNVWIKAHRRKEMLEGPMQLNLKNVSLDRFVRIELDAVTPNISPADIATCFPGCYQLSQDEIAAADVEFPRDESQLRFRGKFELEFVHRYLSLLREECGNASSRFYNPRRSIKLTLAKGNLVSELSNYGQCNFFSVNTCRAICFG